MAVGHPSEQSGTLPSSIMQNPKKDNYYLTITTQIGEETIDPSMPMDNDMRNDSVDVNETAGVR